MKLPSPKEADVLRLLATGVEMYGLEMVNAGVGLKRGTIYVVLSRLEDEKWITSREETGLNRPGLPRPLYKITGIGQRALSAFDAAKRELERAIEDDGSFVPGGAVAVGG